jgi:hypothetical protein
MIFSDQILQKECSPVEHQIDLKRKHTNNPTHFFMLYQLKVEIIYGKGGCDGWLNELK